MVIIVFLLPFPSSHTVMSHLCQLYTAVIILAKMFYQLHWIPDDFAKSNCSVCSPTITGLDLRNPFRYQSRMNLGTTISLDICYCTTGNRASQWRRGTLTILRLYIPSVNWLLNIVTVDCVCKCFSLPHTNTYFTWTWVIWLHVDVAFLHSFLKLFFLVTVISSSTKFKLKHLILISFLYYCIMMSIICTGCT